MARAAGFGGGVPQSPAHGNDAAGPGVKAARHDISGPWRASRLPVGLGLMLMTGVISLLRSRHRLAALSAILTVAAVAGAFYAASGVFPKLGNYNLLLIFVGLVGGLVF